MDDKMEQGHLYDIMHNGDRFIGFFVEEVKTEDDLKECFYCFDIDGFGDYLFFPIDEMSAVEHKDSHLIVIVEFLKEENNSLGWLTNLIPTANPVSDSYLYN